jgi:pectinesterase
MIKSILTSTIFAFLIIKASTVFCSVPDTVHFVVAIDGSGHFRSVQEAINAVPDLRKAETLIFIKKGVYKEKLTLPPTKTNVTLIGELCDSTILTYDDYAQKQNRLGENIGTSGSSSFFVFGDGFTAHNITFENSAGPVGQAVAVRITGDRARFFNCKFLGNQDTLYPHGTNSKQYYKNCYIEGTVDFIFGSATAVFDQCTIFAKREGYITAASTPEHVPYGFVFINCKITGTAPEGSVYLGRPWRPFAKTAFLNCHFDAIVHKKGWHNWNKTDAQATVKYIEYNNTGPGAKRDERVKWSTFINDNDAISFNIHHIFRSSVASGSDFLDWQP